MWSLLTIFACRPPAELGAPGPATPPDTGPGAAPTAPDPEPLIGVVGVSLHDRVPSVVVIELAARVPVTVQVTASVRDVPPIVGPAVAASAGATRLPVLGLPAGAEVSLSVHAAAGGEATTLDLQVTTGDLPGLPEFVASTYDPDRADPTRYLLLTCATGTLWGGDPWAVVVLDRRARPVWAWTGPPDAWMQYVQRAASGDALLVGDISPLGAKVPHAQVQRVRFDGVVAGATPIEDGHHTFVELPDGRLAWGAWRDGVERLQVQQPDGGVTTLWDSDAWGRSIGALATTQSNALSYDAASDQLVLSLWNRDTVLLIDATTGTIRRQLGAAPGSAPFADPASAFEFQHGAHLLADGHLLLTSTTPGAPTFAREYAIDGDPVVEAWSSDADGLAAPQMGEPHRLPNGNTLMNFGTTGAIREITPDADVVWAVDPTLERAVGRMIPLDDLDALWPAAW
jgi:hypothetical protein